MLTKSYRLQELFNPDDQRSLILDTSAGLSLGAVKGLENFKNSVEALLPLLDGIITSPGQSRNISDRTKHHASLLIRADWTNALRGQDFVLPSQKIHHFTLLTPVNALDLGASAVVLYFLLGHEEYIEADCLKKSVQFALQGSRNGIPLILDIHPTGDRVVLRSKAIELGISYALEAGADGAAIPWPGEQSINTILDMSAEMPVWIKQSESSMVQGNLDHALESGCSGIWLDERIFSQSDALKQIQSIMHTVHPDKEVHSEGMGA